MLVFLQVSAVAMSAALFGLVLLYGKEFCK
jgi:hypothetical protein